MSVRFDTISLYMITAAISYIIIFFLPQLAFPTFSLFLSWSYFLIVIRRRFFPVVTLIVYARMFVGFSAANGPLGYNEFNILVNYLPIILYFLSTSRPLRPSSAVNAYPWTYLYGGLLLIYSLISGLDALSVLGDRLLPLFLFLVFLLRGTNEKCFLEDFATLMRYLLLATIFVLSFPGYLELTVEYLQSGIVFGEESISSFQLGDLMRGLGPFWDPRILGTMSALYLAVLLSSQRKIGFGLDLVLATSGLVISLSRGALALSAVIIFMFLSNKVTRTKLLIIFVGMSFLAAFGPFFIEKYLVPIFTVNSVNPLEQRSGFAVAAFMKFLENPLGHGVGSMRNLSDGVEVLGTVYFAITDAYWAILLAEIGIVGIIIFLLSFREIFWSSSPVSKGLFLGFIIQMIGTDLGDFGMYYLVIMIVGTALCRDNVAQKKRNFGINV